MVLAVLALVVPLVTHIRTNQRARRAAVANGPSG
jgi:hypothetical protein